MFEANQRRAAGSGANRWLILAGLGLLVLGLVLRMMLDIGAVGGKEPDTAAADTAAVGTEAVGEAAVDTAAVGTAAERTAVSPTAVSPTAAAPTATPYMVQLGLFSRQANAESLQTRAAALGYTATVHPLQRGARTLYRVSVDDLPTMEAAKRAADSLRKALGVEALASGPQ